MLATLESPAFLARVALTSPARIKKARQAVKRAFQMQLNEMGFSMVEILSACPTNWRMSPQQANRWIEEEMMRYFPLGVFKDRG